LGASDDELGKLENYAISHQGSGQGGDEIKFNTYDHVQNKVADVLVLGARFSDTKLPDTTDIAGLKHDDSIKLIGLMEAQGQHHLESSDAASAATMASISIASESINSSASGSEQMTILKTPNTSAMDLPIKTLQASSETKKSQREAQVASLDFNGKFAASKATFLAPMFLMAGPIIEIGSGLKFLNSDDEEDDEDKKEAKRKKKAESK
jgi:hypothetical protein